MIWELLFAGAVAADISDANMLDCYAEIDDLRDEIEDLKDELRFQRKFLSKDVEDFD